MTPIQGGETKQEEVRPRVTEGAAGTPATVESAETATRLQMITLPTHAPSHKKKDDPNRSVTPYPRGRSGSRERGGASQGSETYRMSKGFYRKEALRTMEGQPEMKASPTGKDESEEEGIAEEGEEGTENERKVNQWLMDYVVKDLV